MEARMVPHDELMCGGKTFCGGRRRVVGAKKGIIRSMGERKKFGWEQDLTLGVSKATERIWCHTGDSAS